MKAMLMLEDGKLFSGEAFGAQGEKIGKVILNTAVVGYQEMLTDPANSGKILVLTYPLIGNYGCAPKFNESKKAWVAGLVIKESSRIYSNWQAKQSLEDFLKAQHLVCIKGVDTRTLAVHLRQKGEMLGIIASEKAAEKELLTKIENFRRKAPASSLPQISVTKPAQATKGKKKIALLDLGVANSLLRQLETLGLSATLLPYNTKPEQLLRLKPKGLIISNGPEEDSGLDEVAKNIRPLLGRLPILGVGLGHQVVACALGAKLHPLKLGHRGVNYPIVSSASFQGQITAQNHGYAVDTDSLNKIKDVKIISYNLNDRSIEEIESKKLKILGAQYLPACPGFDEVSPILKKFTKMLK